MCFRNCWILLLIVLVIEKNSYAFDFPGEFAQNPSGSLALSGLPGFRSTPARFAEPGFGVSYAQVSETEIQVVSAAGEMGWGRETLGFRTAFFSSYMAMDSIYRQVYSEIDASVFGTWYVVGFGYGLSVNWIPAEEEWTENRYKLGSAVLWRPLALSGMLVWNQAPNMLEVGYGVSIRAEVAERFYSFLEYDGESFDIGTAARFKFMTIRSAYRFPEFGVVCSVEFALGGVNVSGTYGFVGQIWDWFGGNISKSVRKKTIL